MRNEWEKKMQSVRRECIINYNRIQLKERKKERNALYDIDR